MISSEYAIIDCEERYFHGFVPRRILRAAPLKYRLFYFLPKGMGSHDLELHCRGLRRCPGLGMPLSSGLSARSPRRISLYHSGDQHSRRLSHRPCYRLCRKTRRRRPPLDLISAGRFLRRFHHLFHLLQRNFSADPERQDPLRRRLYSPQRRPLRLCRMGRKDADPLKPQPFFYKIHPKSARIKDLFKALYHFKSH